MAQFYNQFTIKIKKTYPWVEYTDTMKACRVLNGAAFKMYIYLSSFTSGDEINFSPQAISAELNISISTIHNAFNELVREEYLQKKEEKVYIFTGHQKL